MSDITIMLDGCYSTLVLHVKALSYRVVDAGPSTQYLRQHCLPYALSCQLHRAPEPALKETCGPTASLAHHFHLGTTHNSRTDNYS